MRNLRVIPVATAWLLPIAAMAAEQTKVNPAAYLGNLYLWFLGFVGIAALFGIVVGGILYMFSESLTTTAAAKAWIMRSIGGILIAATSYLLLNTISPDLVRGFDLQTIIRDALEKGCQKYGC